MCIFFKRKIRKEEKVRRSQLILEGNVRTNRAKELLGDVVHIRSEVCRSLCKKGFASLAGFLKVRFTLKGYLHKLRIEYHTFSRFCGAE